MTLKSNWTVMSDGAFCRQSVLSACNFNSNVSPQFRSSNEKHTISTLNQLSLNHNELLPIKSKTIENSMWIPFTASKEQYYSTSQHNIDSFTCKTRSLQRSMLNSSEALSYHKCQLSPIDGIHTLTNWFQTCTLNENKLSTNCFWSNYKSNNHKIHSMKPLSTGESSNAKSKTPSFLVQSSSKQSLFDQQKSELQPCFSFTSATIGHDLSFEEINTVSSDMSSTSNEYFSNQSSTLSSSPLQVVPSSSQKSSSLTKEDFSSPHLRPCQMKDLEFLNTKEDLILKNQSSSQIFFILLIFAVGLVLGYLLKNTYSINIVLSWIDFIREDSFQITMEYIKSLHNHLQALISSFSAFIFV